MSKTIIRAMAAAGVLLSIFPFSNTEYWANPMTLCPIALAVGCKKCPAFTVCPLKGVIGDYKKPEGADPKQQGDGANRDK